MQGDYHTYLDPVLELNLSASVYTDTFKCLSSAIVRGVATGTESIDDGSLCRSAWRICLDRTVAAAADVISHCRTWTTSEERLT